MRLPLPGTDGRCPLCDKAVQFKAVKAFPSLAYLMKAGGPAMEPYFATTYSEQISHRLEVSAAACPSCGGTVIAMRSQPLDGNLPTRSWFVWPEGISRHEIPTAVPAAIAADFREAVLVLPVSPKASAALSRRCLQHLLREQGYAQHDLVKQIDALTPDLPKYLRHDVDLVRVVGNFAAHPMKATTTGEIVEVADGEAEWLLEVLEELFDFFYVRPDESSRRKLAINAKLTAAGKKPIP